MPDDLVRWNDLHNYFMDSFPATTGNVIESGRARRVTFMGRVFEIRPRPGGRDFDVYGPPALTPVALA